MKFIRRLSDTPDYTADLSVGGRRCPEIWELENGDFAIIGEDITEEVTKALPEDTFKGMDNKERIIRIPKDVMCSAKQNIPDK